MVVVVLPLTIFFRNHFLVATSSEDALSEIDHLLSFPKVSKERIKVIMKITLVTVSAIALSSFSTSAYVPSRLHSSRHTLHRLFSTEVQTRVETMIGTRTEKPTGTSFLPSETIERCKSGSPIEKVKIEKDATAAWVDIYEYARKIREGEMTWEEVEKTDLDTVSTKIWHPG